MQHLKWREMARRAARGAVCPGCHLRPPGSEKLGPAEPRSCEGGCPIFINLPTLIQIAGRYDVATLKPYEKAMRELICQDCLSSPTAGDFCAERTTSNCPLSRYSNIVIEALEQALAVNPASAKK